MLLDFLHDFSWNHTFFRLFVRDLCVKVIDASAIYCWDKLSLHLSQQQLLGIAIVEEWMRQNFINSLLLT